jgi:hypothetical protein
LLKWLSKAVRAPELSTKSANFGLEIHVSRAKAGFHLFMVPWPVPKAVGFGWQFSVKLA